MSDQVTVKQTREQEVESETTKARERALKRVRERDAVSEGFKSHTKGEKLFNDLTYTGFGYFGVTGLSVFMTWLIRDSKPFWGMKEPLSHHFNNLVEKIAKWPKMSAGSARSILTIGTLFTGGSLMTITGVKALEDNKAKLVKAFDKQIYGEDAVNHNPELIEAHRIIDAQPKQTWSSVGYSRLVAFVATISSWLLIGQNNVWMSKKLNTSIDTVGTQFGRWSSRVLNHNNAEQIANIEKAIEHDKDLLGPNMRDLHHNDKGWTRILSYMGMDGLYTVITSVGLFISTRVLAPVFDKDGLDRLERRAPKDTPKESQAQGTGVKSIPVDQLDRVEDSALPRVKVSNVQAEQRLAEQPEQNLGAPA